MLKWRHILKKLTFFRRPCE